MHTIAQHKVLIQHFQDFTISHPTPLVLKPGPRLPLHPHQLILMCEGESLRTRLTMHTLQHHFYYKQDQPVPFSMCTNLSVVRYGIGTSCHWGTRSGRMQTGLETTDTTLYIHVLPVHLPIHITTLIHLPIYLHITSPTPHIGIYVATYNMYIHYLLS